MKKKFSSVVALLFIVFTIFSGGAKAFGANSAILPENTKGTLTIHKHWAEDNSQIGNEGNGVKDEDIKNPPVEHIQFNVYELTPVPGNDQDVPPSEKDGAIYLVNTEKTELTIEYNGQTYKYSMGTAKTGKTDADGELVFSALRGFYYVEEDLANSTNPKPTIPDGIDKKKEVSITSPARPFIISVPMTNTEGTGWNTDVHVYPKNQGTTPTKTVGEEGETNIVEGSTGNSVNVGDSFPFTIRTNIPVDIDDSLASDSNTKKYSKFDLWDKFDDALTYNNDVGVYVYKKASNGTWSRQQITPNDDSLYTINYNASILTVSFTELGRTKLAELMNGTDKWTHVGLYFTAIVNEGIHEKDSNTVENQATVTFENEGGSGTEQNKETDPTETNTGDIEIDKKDQKGDALEGAEFQIAKDKTAAEAGEYIKVKVTDGKITDLVYHGDPGYDAALNWIVRPHATTGLGVDNGTFYAAKFQGLQTHTGLDAAKTALKYFVVETKAPSEYNLLDAPVEVDFADEETTHIVSKEIVNSKGFKLPNTGSIGMILLTVLGIVLIGLAILMFLPKKRRS